MCVSPIRIRNPNKGKSYIGLNFLKDCESDFINVPCGVCCQCIALNQMYLVQRVQMEAIYNDIYFSTLTYDNEHLPSLLTSQGYSISFADLRDVQLMIKRIRDKDLFGEPFRYLCVSEFGSERGRPHFHILWLFKKRDTGLMEHYAFANRLYDVVFSQWSRNIGTNRKPIYEPLFTYHSKYRSGKFFSNFDLHYVVPSLTSSGCSDVAFYVLKYMLKGNSKVSKLHDALKLNYDAEEFSKYWSLIRPKLSYSPFFGYDAFYGANRTYDYNSDIVSYLRSCVSKTPREIGFPNFYSPDSGKSFPLCPFYRSNSDIYSVSDAIEFYDKSPDLRPDKDISIYIRQIDNFVETCKITDLHSFDDQF